MSPPLVGRDPELEILGHCLSEAHAGKGMAVLISGAPRIGKTSLLDELCVRAEAQDFRVLRTRPAPKYVPGDLSAWPYLIRNLVPSEPQNIIGPHWPIECPTFATATDANKEACSLHDKGVEFLLGLRRDDAACSDLLRDLFETVSRERPLLVTVDDLDDTDEPLLALVQIASQRFHNVRALFAAAYMSPQTSVKSLARSTVHSIGRHAHHIELDELEPAATAELLRHVAGNAFDEAAVHQVHDLTGGNPGLIMDTAYARVRSSRLNSSVPVDVGVPRAVRVVIQQRLAVLSPQARRLLGIASAIGNTFTPQLLLNLVPLAVEDALAALAESEAAGLIRPIASEGYRFVMRFVRKVLNEEFPSTKRTSLHRQIAAALQAQHAQKIDAHAGDIALHLLASREADAIQQAVDLAELGASHSSRAQDYQSALIMHSVALEALDISHQSDDTRRCDILIALAEAQQQGNDVAGAQESLYEAAEIAQRLGDWPRLADLVLAAPALHWPFPGVPNGLVIFLAEKILQSLPEQDAIRRVLVMARWAAELSYQREERAHSEQLSAHALEMLDNLAGDDASMLKFLRLRDRVLRRPEQAQERLDNSLEVIRIARQQSDWVALFEGEWARKVSSFQLGSAGAKTGLELLEHAARLAGPKYRCLVPAFGGVQAIFNGRFAEGEELFATCREIAVACGLTELPDQLWPAMMMPLDEQGRLAELEQVVARCSRVSAVSASLEAMRCWFAARQGNTSEARFHLERLATDAFADLKGSRGLLVEAAALTEVCTDLADVPHHAAALYELLLPYQKCNAVRGMSAAFGAVSRYLGKLALSLPRFDQAIVHLRAAIEFNNRIGARPWAAYASFELATALLAQGHCEDRRCALELLATAHSEATTMGMKRLARSIRAVVERIEIDERDFIAERSFIDASTHYFAVKNTLTASTHSGDALSGEPNFGKHSSIEATLPIVVECDRPVPDSGVFRPEGEYWTVLYLGKTIRLKHLKGLDLIAYLLSRPHQEVHVLELSKVADLGTNGIAKVANHTDDGSDLGPMLDNSAKQAYRQRIRDLREESEQARAFNDSERASKIDEEIRLIARELVRAIGLDGRDRKVGSSVERARLRVTNSIRWATNKISGQHPALGRFLVRNIKTGTFCSYDPASNDCPDWNL